MPGSRRALPQHVRRSQFVTTWGPGAILEGEQGPRLVPHADIGLFRRHPSLKPEQFEICNPRLAELLGSRAHVFRLPSNAELGKPPGDKAYDTFAFPGWFQCNRHDILYRSDRGCEKCGGGKPRNTEASRFVLACLDGHLDDVDWDRIVHREGACSNKGCYEWKGEGGPLALITVVCPKCRRSANVGEAYSRDHPCRGRFPEKEDGSRYPRPGGCQSAARIMQRQATNLRIPEIVSLFTITPAYTRLHNLLQVEPIKIRLLIGSPPASMSELETELDNLVKHGYITDALRREILLHDWDAIRQAIEDVNPNRRTGNKTPEQACQEELDALIGASIDGVPPQAGPRPLSDVLFEVKRSAVRRDVHGPAGHVFRIVPVSRLNVVMVQTGYRRQPVPDRDPGPKSRVVPSAFEADSGSWYPGVELMGEGLFIMPDDDRARFTLDPPAGQEWREAYPGGAPKQSPEFVWWHTLSHLLLRVLAVDSGYSAASIRERVYLSGTSAGVILYSVQPGSDGTLGGLVSLADSFGDLLERAVELAEVCSNDPLCSETRISAARHSGAACYACLLASETSCEERNMWLDRNVLLADPP
ncbi:MAG: DUF1998 domain-containing protein [Thermoplasmata archaeon]